MQSLYLENEADTEELGGRLALLSADINVITLSGNLGTGKTTLTRGFLRALGHRGAVKSPTYTIVEPYDIAGRRVMHFDLYRLEDPEELEYLGFRDYLDGSALCLFEWPEKAGNLLPPADLSLQLQVEKNGRLATWLAHTKAGDSVSRRLLGAGA